MTAAVLFDVDGALLRLDVDIEEVRMRLAALFGAHGVTLPFRPVLARTREAAREAAEHGGNGAELLRRGFAIIDEWEVAAARTARGRAGVGEAVARLVERGARLGLVTDFGRACLAPALLAAGIDAKFGVVVTRDDVDSGKPDPAGIVKAARALGGEALYVCAHANDVEAGCAAKRQLPGLRVAAFRGPHATEAKLRAAGADTVLGEPAEILAVLGGASC